MPTLPELSDLSRFVVILDQHPFGALMCIVLVIVLASFERCAEGK